MPGKHLHRFSVVILLNIVLVLCGCAELVLCREGNHLRMMLGGVEDVKGSENDMEIDSLARFAIGEHNKKENALLEFERVLKAKKQVVSGKMYHLTLEASDGGNKKIYEAKVWVKPWMNFKQLKEFKHAPDASSLTTSDLGSIRGFH